MDDEVLTTVDKPLPDEVQEAPEAKKPEDSPTPEGGEAEEAEEPEAEPGGEDGEKPEEPEDKPKRKPSRTQRKIARLEARLEEALSKLTAPETKAAESEKPPKPEDFADYATFERELTRYEVRQALKEERKADEEARSKSSREQAARTMVEKRDALYEAGAEKFEDFADVFGDDVPVSDAMAHALLESDAGHEVAYYLGNHLDEAARISKMNPIAAARALTFIEAKLKAPVVKKTTDAPDPINTVGVSAKGQLRPEKMDNAEYRAARKAGKI